MSDSSVHLIPAGVRFTLDDLCFWSGKQPGDSFSPAVAARIDTVLLSPHASAAFPAELAPFLSPDLTRRQQYDFSDVSVDPVGIGWAARDPHVVYIRTPHSRLVFDANRAPPEDFRAGLCEFFARLRQQRAGESGVTFKGVDAVRPITFGGQDVLLEPADEEGWCALCDTLQACALQGTLAYRGVVDQVMESVLANRPADRPLTIISWHDTCTWKFQASTGAIVVERPIEERMPTLVNFGNRGDLTGEARPEVVPLTAGDEMRRVAAAWASAFGTGDQDFGHPPAHAVLAPISFNTPYPGGYEVYHWFERLQEEKAISIYQVEFDRDFLLGPKNAEVLKQPGECWVKHDEAHVESVVACLASATQSIRTCK